MKEFKALYHKLDNVYLGNNPGKLLLVVKELLIKLYNDKGESMRIKDPKQTPRLVRSKVKGKVTHVCNHRLHCEVRNCPHMYVHKEAVYAGNGKQKSCKELMLCKATDTEVSCVEVII